MSTKTMMTENYCDNAECEDVIHAVVDTEDFYNFKIGRIRCHCGTVMFPCNECQNENGEHYECANCPWKNAEIVNVMTGEEYIKWVYENEHGFFLQYLKGECGEVYRALAKKFANSIESKRTEIVDEHKVRIVIHANGDGDGSINAYSTKFTSFEELANEIHQFYIDNEYPNAIPSVEEIANGLEGNGFWEILKCDSELFSDWLWKIDEMKI